MYKWLKKFFSFKIYFKLTILNLLAIFNILKKNWNYFLICVTYNTYIFNYFCKFFIIFKSNKIYKNNFYIFSDIQNYIILLKCEFWFILCLHVFIYNEKIIFYDLYFSYLITKYISFFFNYFLIVILLSICRLIISDFL